MIVIEYILSIFGFDKRVKKLSTSLTRMEAKIQKTLSDAHSMAAGVELRATETTKVAARLQQEMKSLLSSLDQYRITVAKLEETLDATREELRTTKLITIPGLVEANQTMLARWEAETQIQVARAVLVRKEE